MLGPEGSIMIQTRSFAFILLALVVFLTGGCGKESAPAPTPESAPEPGRYYDEARGFSIKFPEGWRVQEENGGVTIAALCPLEDDNDIFYECVSVTVEELPYEMTVDEVFASTMNGIDAAYGGVHVDATGDLSINGIPSKWVFFSYKMEEGTVQAMEYDLTNGRRAYYITCDSELISYASYADILQNSAKTFRFE
jgi:hypothetical protein